MRAASVIDAGFLGGLSTFFDRTCTIQEITRTKAGTGQRVASWSDLAGHVSLACRVAPVTALTRAARVERPDMTVTTVTHLIILSGAYPAITTAHQAVVDGAAYRIASVIRDSERCCTELEVEAVTT